ncbi:MAG: dTMP kinase [Candidatus Aenigmatarchaeota archaeon]
MHGKFLVIEGMDGCGKSTQVKQLVKLLTKKNIPFHLTEEPWTKGLRPIIKELISSGTKLDDAALDALLYTTDRRLHIKKEIEPELAAGKLVICDRYYHSTFTYQQVQGIEFSWLRQINRFSMKPDITIIFDVPPETAIERLVKDDKRKTFDKFEKLEFLKKLRAAYLALPALLKDEKIVVIDANRPPDKVFEDLKLVLVRELELKL